MKILALTPHGAKFGLENYSNPYYADKSFAVKLNGVKNFRRE